MHGPEHTKCGHQGRVAAAPQRFCEPHHVLCLVGDPLQVIGRGAHVLGGDETAIQGVHEPAIGAEHGLRLVGAGIGHDEALAAAQGEAGHR
uniref:Uncharacterized protein n=1 Tax=uncultured marine microorganism HF4000_APKG7H23 TaxID=455551 RepID=B3T9U9_9ZZZZ|nr:hypothetical protein ALOHA_HF4000APKG7H23ctg3g23 [uncultured marine microorganism HF4000_APKG7H23]